MSNRGKWCFHVQDDLVSRVRNVVSLVSKTLKEVTIAGDSCKNKDGDCWQLEVAPQSILFPSFSGQQRRARAQSSWHAGDDSDNRGFNYILLYILL